MKKPESNKSYYNRDATPENDLWTDGLICAFEFVRGPRKLMNTKSASKVLGRQIDGEYAKTKLQTNGIYETSSPGPDNNRVLESSSLSELRDSQVAPSEVGSDSQVPQSGQFHITERFEGSHWVPIGWARISELVQTVQSNVGWATQQLELMDGEDDLTVADLAAPYWERPAGPIWWCHLSAGHPSVQAWLNNAHWLHPAISLALRDESRLISERMKYLLYEVPVRVAGGLLFELLGQSAGDPFVDEDDIPIVLRSWQAQNFLITAQHIKGHLSSINVLGIAEVQELLFAGGSYAPRTVHEVIAHLPPGHNLPRMCPSNMQDDIASTDVFLPHNEDENIFDVIRVVRVHTLPYIPMRCRLRVGLVFLKLLQDVTSNPSDLNKWATLQMFPKCVLSRHPDSKGFSGGSPAVCVSSNLDEWDKGGSSIRHLWQQIVNGPKKKTTAVTLLPDDLKKHNIKRARKLAGHGRLSDACRALTSAGVAVFTESVMQELREKHPQLQVPCIPPGQVPESLMVDWPTIWSCIKSFPRATACGRDGLRAQHLIDIVAGFSNDPRKSALERQLLEFINLHLKGVAPSTLAPFIASAPIMALQKQSGGIRPIAIGEIWRRLVSKVAQQSCRGAMTDYLSPLQVGVGVKAGSEAVVHAVNSVLRSTQNMRDIGVLKIDFSNAFNLISRAHFFRVVRDICPLISAWVEYCYGSQAILYAGDNRLYSCTGVQQGDPLGPLLFALALHPLVLRIREECPTLFLHSWYLDDGVMIGAKEDLRKVLEILQSQGPCLGLMLNIQKTEIWLPHRLTSWTDFPQYATFSFGRTSTLLGCPISPTGEEVEVLLTKPTDNLKHILGACRDLHDPQLQLLLLRACTGFPKINHLLRSAPPDWIPNTISIIDEMIHSALEDIWNRGISRQQRTLIGLPIRLGGFGIPVPFSAALSAYLGSRFQTLELQRLLINFSEAENSDMGTLVDDWNLQFPRSERTTPDEIATASKPQQLLNGRAHEVIRAALISTSEPRIKTLIHANGYNHSGAWTTALPVSAWGTVMRPELFRLALRYRSGHLIFNESKPCSLCSRNQVSDSYGDHDSFCAGKGRLIRRHNHLRDALNKQCA